MQFRGNDRWTVAVTVLHDLKQYITVLAVPGLCEKAAQSDPFGWTIVPLIKMQPRNILLIVDFIFPDGSFRKISCMQKGKVATTQSNLPVPGLINNIKGFRTRIKWTGSRFRPPVHFCSPYCSKLQLDDSLFNDLKFLKQNLPLSYLFEKRAKNLPLSILIDHRQKI
jgi:hypothetical protein